tara:strand:+ start:126 stop:266 length:141 start_codon:yes stop_codon:yes gene_type:complete
MTPVWANGAVLEIQEQDAAGQAKRWQLSQAEGAQTNQGCQDHTDAG